MPGSSNADTIAPATAPAFESFIITPDDWTKPLDLTEHFDPSKPLHVDLGCGRGDFLAAHAAAHPECNFLGIDRLLIRIRKSAKRIMKAGISNARVIRLEASYTLERLLPPASITTLYVFFPDPWPKRRHHDRRLFDDAFLGILLRVLTPDAFIHIATDHADYAQWIDKVFARNNHFTPVTPAFVTGPEERTQFESEFLAQGLPINRRSFSLSSRSEPALE